MKFNSQICTTKEQSERLLALGLKKETADCCWSFNIGVYDESRRYTLVLGKCEYMHDIPAWSFHRLLELCNVYYLGHRDYDSLISYVKYLIKEDHFNKEYLEE